MRGTDYIVRRFVFALVTVFVAVTLNFLMFRALPGDAVSDLSRVPYATPELKRQLVLELGLDKPKGEQYLIYLKQLAGGDLGVSYANQQPVLSNLWIALKNSIPMVALGTLLAIALGTLTGVIVAWRHRMSVDRVLSGAALGLFSLPAQWLGLMLLIAFAGVLPSGGITDDFLVDPSFLQQVTDVLAHMALPSLTLALGLYGGYVLVVRSAMLETLREDYILTARAKGLRARTILRRHALRNAMLPITTLVALSLGYVVTGAILVETVFSWPGIGRALYEAVLDRDYPMLQGGFLVLTVSVVFLNLMADLLYARLDPRVQE